MQRSSRTIWQVILACVMFVASEAKLQAAVITLEGIVVASTSGLTLGETGTGSITYDETLVVPDGFISPDTDPTFALSFTIFGQTFTEADDIDFSGFPELSFDATGIPEFLDYIVNEADPFNPTSIIDARVLGFDAGPLTQTSPGVFSMELFVIEAGGIAAVPEPNSIALLCVGAVGLIGYSRRKQNRVV